MTSVCCFKCGECIPRGGKRKQIKETMETVSALVYTTKASEYALSGNATNTITGNCPVLLSGITKLEGKVYLKNCDKL